ncbi:response regulator transcription factor [Paucibacter sp. DJ2R-2]|uniref:response regulator transcription factor n=1 Tax=Paucibacter sp. DJ2R-2 TaxID=2893558 RepID=UPI0021E4837F|nr:response regulator transcription factor [Paucibacter sp. DJ2R-2]MCV2422434.1 response regulator transcription factor [Paucibacter sp. DJ4R-1]MCV2440414.1 response regulator transcription factor [Paucibacter sp. DJ2R-2]
MKLLVIEDNQAMQTTLQRSFERRGFQVSTCDDGERALSRWRASLPDVVLLDLSMPGRDGLDVLSEARAEGLNTPVIIITARGTLGDRILGLNIGADDYLPKPFDLDELEARVRALVRRRGSAAAPEEQRLAAPAFCGLRADPESGAVYLQGQVLDLAPREAALLRALLAKPGQAVAKERLFDLVFADASEALPDAIEVVAYRLRKKLAASGSSAKLATLRGLGYLLQADDSHG